LAFGYQRGGQYKGNYPAILRKNFMIAAGLLGVGLSYAFIHYLFVVGEAMVSHVMFSLMAYLLLITAPAVYFLGQTVPITTNLFKRDQHIGAISGRVLFLSTIGSFVGAVLTS
jgi:hypothetical protein